jgi:glucosamine--fructose-6-phosphate aminotransferase (isomerizing)
VTDVLIEGLKRLEYRGYDSAGIATIESSGLDRICAVGKVANLATRLSNGQLRGHVGIAHTRWATHGRPSEANSHPHTAPGVAVVHNGIIENHRELRDELSGLGCKFRSETDTEVVPWLVHQAFASGKSTDDALRAATTRLEGSYALATISERSPDRIHATRRGSPLVVAVGERGSYVSSDPSSLAGLASEAICLEDGDFATVTRGNVTIVDSSGRSAMRRTIQVDSSEGTLHRGSYEHFMLKEIHEQPSLARLLTERYEERSAFKRLGLDFVGVERIRIVACGSSYYAGLMAKRWFEELSGIEVEVSIASEFRYSPMPRHVSGELALFISQSGETADTLASHDRASDAGLKTVGLVNQQASTLGRIAKVVVPLLAGPEVGVASTKAFLAQLLVFARMAIAAAHDRRESSTRLRGFEKALRLVPDQLDRLLRDEDAVKDCARAVRTAQNAIFIARGPLLPLALEGALKLKEISYIHAEGMAAGELKHGPIALVDEAMPVFALATTGDLLQKVASNIREVAARGGRITLVGDQPAIKMLSDVTADSIALPQTHELAQPILAAAPLQLLAYHVALQRGLDVDRPRNLAKSVTVE